MKQRGYCLAAVAVALASTLFCVSPVQSFLLTPHNKATITSSRALSLPRLAAEGSSDSSKGKFKGFGEPPKKPEPKPKSKAQLEREKYASAYEDLASKGVPEYVVYIREKGGESNDWKFVGSLAVPRTLKVDEVIFENEENLVKGAMRMYPQMKKVSQESLEYGYNLKKFPDEPIKVAVRKSGGGNPVVDWIERTISPLDASGINKK